MRCSLCRGALRWRAIVALAISFLLAVAYGNGPGACSRAAASDSGTSIVRVEEDWALVVDAPDLENVAPQVTCVISPIGNADSLYAALDLNHHSQPDFAGGGLQLQVWTDDGPIATVEAAATDKLHHNDEQIQWTQRIDLHDGVLTFSVVNGHSNSWGEFGGNNELSIVVNTSLGNLNDYSPQVSVENSGIGFASNRVKSLKIIKVRVYTGSGEMFEDSTSHTVYQRD